MRGRLEAVDPRERLAGFIFAVLLGSFFFWWAWKAGAFFGTVFFPGAIAIFVLLGMLAVVVPLRTTWSASVVAPLALVGIGVWTLIAMLWSPDRSVAVGDAYIAFVYAAIFGIGVFATRMLGRRSEAALAPVAAAAVAVGVGTVITLACGTHLSDYLHPDATLRFPFGYRNADAAFFMAGVWALLSLCSSDRVRWPLRAAMIAAATMLLELTVLAESRGSAPAAAVALIVYLILSPNRLRPVTYLALAAVPVAVGLHPLLHLFQHEEINGAMPLVRSASHTIIWTTILSLALAAVTTGLLEPRLQLGPAWTRRVSRGLVSVAVLAVVGGIVAVLAVNGGPANFIEQRVHEFDAGVSPAFTNANTRFGANLSSERQDLWRVAGDEFLDRPIGGGGPGSFEFAYLRHRHTEIDPKDPHSVEMLMLSELGVPGFALFVCFLVAATVAAIRSRRTSRSAAVLVAGALTIGAYWLVQSSYDWFWHYPGLTAPVMFLLGAASAPALKVSVGYARRRLLLLAPLAALGVLAVPLFFSVGYVDRALDIWRAEPAAAYDDLDDAASLNPLEFEPFLIKGAIAERRGEDRLAIEAFEKAERRVPESYAPHYFLARLLEKSEPTRAHLEAARAYELNPRDPGVLALRHRLARRGKRRGASTSSGG